MDTQARPPAVHPPEAWPWEAQALSLGTGVAAPWPAPGQPGVAATYWRMLRGAGKPAWVDPEAAHWPRLDMATPRLALSPDWLARYRQRVMDERAVADLAPSPGCWPLAPFVLASRWQMAMLAHPQAPLRVLGAVHTGLQLRQWRPAQAGEALRWRLVSVPGVRHARGVEHGLLVLWHDESGLPVGHALSTYLLPQPREGGGPGPGRTPGSLLGLAERPLPELSPQGQAWPLPVDYGRRYAPVSLDFNPIHLWAWSARWLGFRQPIAHGMALAARALADASTRMPGLAQGAGRLSLRWLKPCLLPRPLTAWCGQDEWGGLHGELRSDGQTPHLRWHWQLDEGRTG